MRGVRRTKSPWEIEYEDSPLSPANIPLPPNLCVSHYDVTRRVRKVLGISDRMPKNFKGKFKVDGHTVVVFPSVGGDKKPGGGGKRLKVQGRKYALHRMFFLLTGGRLIPTGRVRQFCIEKRRVVKRKGGDVSTVVLAGAEGLGVKWRRV